MFEHKSEERLLHTLLAFMFFLACIVLAAFLGAVLSFPV